jgi:hypothetical protein
MTKPSAFRRGVFSRIGLEAAPGDRAGAVHAGGIAGDRAIHARRLALRGEQ